MRTIYNFARAQKKRSSPVLFCPGPVQLHRSVKKALGNTQVCHRDKDFEEMIRKLRANVLAIAHADPKNYSTLFVTGSGTSANETSLIALGKLGPLLVITNGEFGERLHKLATIHHNQVDTVSFGWAEKINLAKVEKQLTTKQYAAVVVVHHETSTGMLNPVQKIAKVAHKHGCRLFVDAVSSLAAEDLRVAEWGIDMVTSSSGKAMSAAPGVGIIIVNNDLLSQMVTVDKTVQYLDIGTYAHYDSSYTQTPNTPSVHIFAALLQSTELIMKMGVEQHRKEIQKRAAFIRQQLKSLGYNYFYYGKDATSNVITCVSKLRPGQTPDEVTDFARERNIILYGGKGELQGKIFQIGHIGNLTKYQTYYLIDTFKKFNRVSSPSLSTKQIIDELHQVEGAQNVA